MHKMSHKDAGHLAFKISEPFLRDSRERSRNAAIEKWEKEKRLCLNCGKTIPYDKRRTKFCDHSCAARFRNKEKSTDTTHMCICGTVLPNCGQSHCSWDCVVAERYEIFIRDWKLGKPVKHPQSGVSDYIRKYLITQRGEHCWECGWAKRSMTTGNIPLEIHHIDGDSTNNVESNLSVLCPNCHSLTPTYRSLNRGNGKRTNRK